MSTPPHVHRRELLASALLTALPLGACAVGDKPVLRCGVGQEMEDVEKHSTLLLARSGPTIVNQPHRIEYEDARLKLTLPDCGAQISMPSVFGVSEGRFDGITSASVLADYVDIREAVHHVGLRLNEVLAQGFQWRTHAYARFARVEGPVGSTAPLSVKSLDEVVDYFTNPQWMVKEIIAFRLLKDGLEVGLRLRNMRRSFPKGGDIWKEHPDVTAAAIDRKMTPGQRMSEKAYYLEMAFVKERP